MNSCKQKPYHIGEVCGFRDVTALQPLICGGVATHKVGDEDTTGPHHNYTQYLCCLHFTCVMGSLTPCQKPMI